MRNLIAGARELLEGKSEYRVQLKHSGAELDRKAGKLHDQGATQTLFVSGLAPQLMMALYKKGIHAQASIKGKELIFKGSGDIETAAKAAVKDLRKIHPELEWLLTGKAWKFVHAKTL